MDSERITRGFVGAILGGALVWVAYVLLGWQGAAAAALLLAYEGWALSNTGRYDTISDIVREFSRKQLLTPWMFGFGFGVAIANGFITDPYVIAALAVLQGHFFFTLNEKREEAIKEEAKVEAQVEMGNRQ